MKSFTKIGRPGATVKKSKTVHAFSFVKDGYFNMTTGTEAGISRDAIYASPQNVENGWSSKFSKSFIEQFSKVVLIQGLVELSFSHSFNVSTNLDLYVDGTGVDMPYSSGDDPWERGCSNFNSTRFGQSDVLNIPSDVGYISFRGFSAGEKEICNGGKDYRVEVAGFFIK